MKPVQQENSRDCVRACMASIMELPIAKIPNFNPETWFEEACKWLQPMGFTLLNTFVNNDAETQAWGLGAVDSSRKGWNHCVVVFGNRIMWDPKKCDDPGTGTELREICYFVPVNVRDNLALYSAVEDLMREKPCEACGGTGAEFLGHPRTEKCEECDGTGRVTSRPAL